MRRCAGRFAINRPSHGRLKLVSTGGAPALKFTVKRPSSGRSVDFPRPQAPTYIAIADSRKLPLGSQTYVGNPDLGFIATPTAPGFSEHMYLQRHPLTYI